MENKKASRKRSINFTKLMLVALGLFVFVLISVTPTTQLLAQRVPSQRVPSGFYRIRNYTGVEVYKKNHQNKQPDYVTVVDLRRATIRSLTGDYSNKKVDRKRLDSFWWDAVANNTSTSKAKVVINGTFFEDNTKIYNSPNPTKIAFGLKVGVNQISDGYAVHGPKKEFPGQISTFSFNSLGASIQTLADGSNTDKESHLDMLNGSTPDVVGALDVNANKDENGNIPRTFVGTMDSDRNGVAEAVLLFSSKEAKQAHADTVLRNFGATRTAMLDGGGSTALIINGNSKSYIRTSRTLPHAIAVYAGKSEMEIRGIGGKCLDVSGGNTRNGTQIQIYRCNETAAQKWRFIDGSLRGIGGKCLDVSGGNTANGTKIQLYSCNNTAAQKWSFEKDSSGQYRFRGIGGKCIDVSGGNTADRTKVQLYSCNNTAAQRWEPRDL